MENFEHLLIASETSDLFGVVVIDPKNGVSNWSYKGNELQGAVIGNVERVGTSGELFLVSGRDKPLLHALSINSRRRFHVKSVLQEAVQEMIATPDGTLLFASFNTQIYAWMVGTGDLVGVFNAHYRRITKLALNFDGTLLISGSEDGSLCAFLVADILSLDSTGIEKITAIAEWRPHSLAVSDICAGRLTNTRIFSCSKDHTVAIYSLTMHECLVKISGDVAISACAVDPAELRLFLGTVKGGVAKIDLFSLNKSDTTFVFGGEHDESSSTFTGHSAEIRRLSVNHDGSLLASGDALGTYTIWDVLSKQCLKTSSSKGAICKLQFVTKWNVVQEDEGSSSKWRPPLTAVLKRQKADKNVIQIPLLRSEMCTAPEKIQSAPLDDMINELILRHSRKSYTPPPTKNSAKRRRRLLRDSEVEESISSSDKNDEKANGEETIEMLKAKVSQLTTTNREIYEFAASLITNQR